MKKVYLALLLMAGSCLLLKAQNAWINEIHYDNTGTDANEFVEVVIQNAGSYNLADFTLTLYNGSGGASYGTKTLDQFTVGATSDGFSLFYMLIAGIQNGAPDGMALSYLGTLIDGQFLSYEGTFTASSGPAAGILSVDIGVVENGSDPVGESLQLSGSGTEYGQFAWQPPAGETPGQLNIGQSFGGAPVNSINYAYARSSTELDVLYNLSLSSVNPANYVLTGTTPITFSSASIDATDNKLVHLSGASASMAGDIIVDNIEDTSIPSDYDFYAGILPVSFTNATNPDGLMDNTHFATFQGIISADDNFNNVWISDNASAYHGVMIYDNNFDALVSVGDEVLVRSKRDVYNNLTELVSPALLSTLSTGNAPYGPTVINGSDISETIPANTDPGEKWEGQLVKIQNFTVVAYDDYDYECSWSDSKATHTFHIGDNVDYQFALIDLLVGQSYASITGVVDWYSSGPYYRINPRSQSDIAGNPTSARIVGSFQDWNTTDPNYVMIAKPNGLLQLTRVLPAGDNEYKVIEGDSWDAPNYPSQNQHIVLTESASVTWKTNINANLVTHTLPTVTGSFLSEMGGTDWDPANTIGEMTDPDNDDIYTKKILIPTGNWESKVTLNKNWDQSTGDNTFFHSNGADSCTFTYDFVTNTTTVTGAPAEYAILTFVINDTEEQTFTGFYLKGSWDATGNYDANWNDGAEHTLLYDDGTHGDAIAGDHIFTAQVNLVVDYGYHTWEWGVNDQAHNWVAGNWQFTIPDTSPQTLTQVFGPIQSLVITEIMYNPPESGNDTLEFLEIYNPGNISVELEGFHFKEGVTFTFPEASLAPEGFTVVAVSSGAMGNFFGVDAYQWTDGALSNGGETVILADNLGRVVDSVTFDDNSPWPMSPDGFGPSLVFCDPSLDNAVADDWSASMDFAGTNAAGDTIFASPGTGCIYQVPSVLITEIMYHPPDGEGGSLEFIELFNRGGAVVDFDDFYFSSGVEHTFQNLQLTPGERVVIAADKLAFQSVFGFMPLQWTSGDLDDDGEILEIKDPFGNVIDHVAYDDEFPWDTITDGYGPSLTFCYPFLDNSLPEYWSVSTEFAGINGNGDTLWASPLEGCTLPDYDIVITEIMYNPPESGTDTLEFVELYNNGSVPVDMEGFYFSEGLTYTFPPVVIEPDDYLVVCVDSVAFHSVFGIAALQWTDGALNNGGENLALRDKFNTEVDFVPFDDEMPWDTLADGRGPSLTLCDPMLDNSLAVSWAASYEFAAVNSAGDTLFATPGAGCGEPVLPVADFSVSSQEILKGMSVDFTDLSTGAPVSWLWQFPGGTPDSSSSQNPSGIFYHESGVYNVTLTVANPDGEDTETKSGYITVTDSTIYALVITEIMYNPPEQGTDSLEFIELYNNDIAPVNLYGFYFSKGVDFTFPDTTLAPGGYLLVAYNAQAILNTFSVPAYQWVSGALSNGGEEIELNDSWGVTQDYVNYDSDAPWPLECDGQGPSLTLCYPDEDNSLPENWNPSTEFAAVNLEGDTIRATPLSGCQGILPQADFMASETILPVGAAIDFTDLSIGSPTAWAWTFDGGSPQTSDDQHPQNIEYEQAGSFTVTLVVTNNLGSDTKSVENYITVGYPPVADFTADVTGIAPGTTVTFEDLSTYNPETWSWSFPGGTPSFSTEQNPEIQYYDAGNFDVELTVTNAFGESTLIKTDYIHVAVGINDLSAALDDIVLYPVPSDGQVILNGVPVPIDLEVYSLIGEKVWKSRIIQTHDLLNFSWLSPGVYFIRFIEPDQGTSIIKKMIIK
ncbi:MAG TPA: lamin tail domain-containing protein [Bacteroidales bacterium]|nr:lamin tail domain-containing protein [Bacteroidales bacterium]HNS46994.1 lamin tail domain-containing protein [Bacteroidales bacterium]